MNVDIDSIWVYQFGGEFIDWVYLKVPARIRRSAGVIALVFGGVGWTSGGWFVDEFWGGG